MIKLQITTNRQFKSEQDLQEYFDYVEKIKALLPFVVRDLKKDGIAKWVTKAGDEIVITDYKLIRD